MRRWLATIVTLTLAAAQLGPAVSSEGSPREVLEAAAAALTRTRAIEFRFVAGGPDHPTGWASGVTRMRRVTDAADSWLYVGGAIHAQPRFDVAEQRFEYAADGDRGYLLDHTARTFQQAALGGGGNALSISATYGFVTDFVDARPLWKELEHASTLELLATDVVDGADCDVVAVHYGRGDGASVTTWWLSRDDRLPRRGEWKTIGSSTPPFVMEFRSPTSGHAWTAEDFALAPRRGYEERPVEAAGTGKTLPAVLLSTPSGEPVRLDRLRGEVLVLDFWNTWCFICRTQTPAIAEMAAELGGDGVRFFGVNVFETGDPVSYWKEQRYPHQLLLNGDELAKAIDLPYQPGIAVIDPLGRVVFSQLGGSPDRADKVRRAIEAARAPAR